jgi:hypothetical protein
VSDIEDFNKQRIALIEGLGGHADLQRRAVELMGDAGKAGYAYVFDWLGLPIIQGPQDIVAVQEVIWHVKQIMKEIRRRTRVVGAFPDGQLCLNLAAARLRYIAGTACSAKVLHEHATFYQPQVVQTEAVA